MDKLFVARDNFDRILKMRGSNPFMLAKNATDENGKPYVRTYFDDFIRGRKRSLKLHAIYEAARALNCSVFYLTGEIGLAEDADEPLPYVDFTLQDGPEQSTPMPTETSLPTPHSPANAQLAGPVTLDSAHTIPVYGQAIGGEDGQFVLNGNHLQDVLAPPSLRGVKGAYGARVAGDSMVPRYYADEVVYMNPNRAVRRGDFVTAQIYGDDEDTVSAYVKEFVTLNQKELVLKQFNPPKELRFPASKVKSVHRIVMGGEG
ncbi:S24 family peptidase [Ancylobacter defluvii]|uniref:Peptidase S24/S26A/S26B/S26C domain-containing protein n=1 Tax=Ancylobacter defluvii TaxID=1282440 RepID=A0A9W6NDG8_9HYPH|nr:S24 family peptidase [Ancylobacter defluvii]MBS7588256.1 helix-turn-helix transcriptional regulator [Ancylobacter defluvii]GLK86652.1 hypothetical protein GCM10017653_47220 [Ancylobacter defluvii]